MNRIDIQYRKTKIGELVFGTFGDRLCLLDFRYRKMRAAVDRRLKNGLDAEFREQRNPLLEEIGREVDEYLLGKRKTFDVPLLMVGSDFQKKVWRGLMGIDYGETASYIDLARSIGKEKAVRAVASANGANAMALAIPCHRIIGSDGGLVGYGGGLAAKKRLLDLERGSAGELPFG